MNTYSSKLLEDAVNEFAALPGIGRKTALRLVLSLLKRPAAEIEQFGNTIIRLRTNINYCKSCNNISETEICNICSNPKRDKNIVCVVEDIRDVLAVENTNQYTGLYHVLGGIISPMEGIGPSQLNIESLLEKALSGTIDEVIMALSTTMEGDTTVFYLYKKLKPFDVKISTIARGIAIGGELEYADEITLGRSIINRTPYENSLVK
ncbi:MAG TPA: recombination mediator RecR [Bacteroidia bacterium]|nr:recombination mediator RecR [Bacteroidia bacterium]